MDVAGALGWTSIFPMVIGIILFIITTFYAMEVADDKPDMHQKRVMFRLLAVTGFFVILAVGGWIVAIWLGYAQGAVG
ncbi:membrane protein [Microbacterium phage Zooman]|nr:membrane protein [Microbacterium phage Zooman]